MIQIIPFLAVGFLGIAAGWYGHMKFGAKAQAVVNQTTTTVDQVVKDVQKL